MKPLVIYLKDNSDEVKLTQKEFEKLINDAYQQGYDQGYAQGRNNYWYYYPWNNGFTTLNNTSTDCPPTNPNPNITSDQFKYSTITACEANNTLGD